MRVGGAAGVGLAGLVAVVGLVAGCGGGGGGDPRGDTIDTSKSATTTVATQATVQSVTAAVPIVQRLLTIKLADNDVRLLVVDLCGAASTGNHGTITQDLEALKLTTDRDLEATITALGRGAEAYCPDGVMIAPNLLTELHVAVRATLSTAGTTTTTS